MANVFLKIEDEIISVPRASLVISEVFEDMFQAPQAQGEQGEEGTTDEEGPEGGAATNPIVLEGEKIAKWRTLIKVLVPMTTGGNVPTGLYLSLPDWVQVLKLATKYNMAPVRTRAIEAITVRIVYQQTQKLKWGLEYHVEPFLVGGAAGIVNSLLDSTLNLSLSMSELAPLSPKTINKLFWIEKAMRSPGSVQHIHPFKCYPKGNAPSSIRLKYSSVKCRSKGKNWCAKPMYPDNLACLTCNHRHGADETFVVTGWEVNVTIRVALSKILCKQCGKSIYSKNGKKWYQCLACKEEFHINSGHPATVRVYDLDELIQEAFKEEIELCY
ncbi:hypothetical protein DFP72DRAFT_1172620 [Ephemerocybe angulata]|uniref:Uncharacterized protein n=1 Tax=Ephemerocybe angulata TaxID=980116 RepID=A0A8H6M0L0_9AGAR|nr:hypothetical protein DFP72DRAFT_1172620 [Tulosesus angulatus]